MSHRCSGCWGWPSHQDRVAQWRTRNWCTINTVRALRAPNQCREYGFMIEPPRWFTVAINVLSVILQNSKEFGAAYISNELSIKKSLNPVRVWTVIKTGLVSGGDERHLSKQTFISSDYSTIGETGLLSYYSKFWKKCITTTNLRRQFY